jgi:hypothetical protein
MISGHPERFAAEIIRLAKDPAMRDEIRAQGAQVVQAVDAAYVVDQLGDLYRSLES